MERTEQLRALWGYRYWIAGFAAAVAILAFLASGQRPNRYDATAVVQVVSGRQERGEFVTNDELLALTNFYGEIARSQPVVEAGDARYENAVEEPDSGLDGSASGIDITARASSQFLDFTGSAGSPGDGAAYANAHANAFSQYVESTQAADRDAAISRIDDRVADIVAELELIDPNSARGIALSRELDELVVRAAGIRSQISDSMRFLQPATDPDIPSSPKPMRDGILAGVAAALLAALAAYGRASLVDRYGSASEISRDIGLPMLAEIPRLGEDDPLLVESLRKLRTQLAFALSEDRHPVILVTSAMPGSGKSHLSRGIVKVFAEEGQRVIVVDADLRRPTQHTVFGLPRAPGVGELMSIRGLSLSQLRAERGSPHLVKVPGGGFIEVLPAGEPVADPAGSLASPQMGNLVDQLKSRYDLTVFDTPPVLPVVDCLALSRVADGVVLIVDFKKDSRSDVRRAVQTLRAVDVALIGFVLNSADVSRARYGYYRDEAEDPQPARRQA